MALALGTVAEISAYLGIPEGTIYRWVRERKLTSYSVRGETRVILEDVMEVVEKSSKVKGKGKGGSKGKGKSKGKGGGKEEAKGAPGGGPHGNPA